MTLARPSHIPARRPTELRSWLALCRVNGLSGASICRLLEHFGSLEGLLGASSEAIMAGAEVNVGQARAILSGPDAKVLKQLDEELRQLDAVEASVLTWLDADYPGRLRTIPDPPPLLYVTGDPTGLDRYALAVVGSRRPTPAGRVLSQELSRDLAALGFTIISGLARGIDAAAHRGALSAGGRTVAVLGCGIEQTYPPEHADLRKQIEQHGAVITELPVGAYPHAYHFPRRNRLISGLSLGVLVTEAALQSGSLITARLAAEQGREVFAVPGFAKAETSRGTNGLIKQGAKLVDGAWDVVEELLPQLDPSFRDRLRRPVTSAPPQLSSSEELLTGLLSAEPTHVDELILRSGLPPAEVASLLVGMELRQVIHGLPGNLYVRV
jgi:DNA processing protein